MKIGRFEFDRPVVLAPMAGISDLPMRMLCREFGADYTVSEMVTAQTRLWDSRKTRPRLDFGSETGPRIIQIAGTEPALLADAAQRAQSLGADIVDINMGCPAKKVLNRQAGSALMREPERVANILAATVAAADIPVTVKIRTGWSPAMRNGVEIARIAEQAGIAAITVHGRTRACAFRGHAEYDTIAAIKGAVAVPVIANGDISSAEEAQAVLDYTRADGVMIGRAARGQPWLFAAIKAALDGASTAIPRTADRLGVMARHASAMHDHYGVERGVMIARKHAGWYLQALGLPPTLHKRFNRLETGTAQIEFIDQLNLVNETTTSLDRAA